MEKRRKKIGKNHELSQKKQGKKTAAAMINPYHNRDTTNRNIRIAERGARLTATVTTSLGAFIWGQDLAARYLPMEWDIAPFLTATVGLLAGVIMGYLTDFMFGNLLQRVTYDTMAASHPNVTKWQGPQYFRNLRRAESFVFAILLLGLFAFDLYTTLIIRDPIADNARTNATTDIAQATATIAEKQTQAANPIAQQITALQTKIKDDERRAAAANPGLQKLAQEGNTWAKQQIAAKKARATKTTRAQLEQLNTTYNNTLAGQSATLATAQTQITDENTRIAAANQRNRNVMSGMYVAFTVIPKLLSIILRILMVITFLAYSVNFHPDLTGDGVIDYADVEAYFQKQKQAYNQRVQQAQFNQPPATNHQQPDNPFI